MLRLFGLIVCILATMVIFSKPPLLDDSPTSFDRTFNIIISIPVFILLVIAIQLNRTTN